MSVTKYLLYFNGKLYRESENLNNLLDLALVGSQKMGKEIRIEELTGEELVNTITLDGNTFQCSNGFELVHTPDEDKLKKIHDRVHRGFTFRRIAESLHRHMEGSTYKPEEEDSDSDIPELVEETLSEPTPIQVEVTKAPEPIMVKNLIEIFEPKVPYNGPYHVTEVITDTANLEGPMDCRTTDECRYTDSSRNADGCRTTDSEDSYSDYYPDYQYYDMYDAVLNEIESTFHQTAPATNPETDLAEAICHNDIETVKQLIGNRGAVVTERVEFAINGRSFQTALAWATWLGRLEIMEYILKHDMVDLNIGQMDTDAFYLAFYNENLEAVKLFYKYHYWLTPLEGEELENIMDQICNIDLLQFLLQAEPDMPDQHYVELTHCKGEDFCQQVYQYLGINRDTWDELDSESFFEVMQYRKYFC